MSAKKAGKALKVVVLLILPMSPVPWKQTRQSAQVYLNWANSVLSEVGKHIAGVADIQEGLTLCQLIDILSPGACLVNKCQTHDVANARKYIETALEHMRSHGIKFIFTVQDLIDGDVKSLLDVLWLIILNYGIHDITQNAYQRSVGIGKKNLLDWCQQEVDAIFDPRNTLTFNLCTGNWFTRLVQKFAGEERSEEEDRGSYLEKLLHKIQEKYAISEEIVSASDIVDGTVDEHTLMIYLSLLKRRVGGKLDKNTVQTSYRLTLPPGGLNLVVTSQIRRSRSASPLINQNSLEGEEESVWSSRHSSQKVSGETSAMSKIASSTTSSVLRSHESNDDDWFSSASGSMISSPIGGGSSGKEGRLTPIEASREQMLKETIRQQVWEHMPQADDAKHDSHRFENNTGADATDRDVVMDQQPGNDVGKTDGSSDIKIRRPKDYFRQWEDTIDRLSQGPVSSDVDSSRSSSRSRSRSQESNHLLADSLRSLSNSPSRSVFSSSHSYTSVEHRLQRKASPSPQRRDVFRNKGKTSESLKQDEVIAELKQRQQAAGLGETVDAVHVQTDTVKQLFDIQQLLSATDNSNMTLALKPGQKIDVMVLFEALRKAREAVDNNMPKDDFRSRRLHHHHHQQQQEDLSETQLKTAAVDLDMEDVSVSQRNGEEKLSPQHQVHEVERDRSPSALIGLSRRHPSPRQLPQQFHPVDEHLTSRKEVDEQVNVASEESGGYRRVPRREAWEREKTLDSISLDASRMDSLAQAKFVEILCKEIEELKHKVEIMDQPRHMVSSANITRNRHQKRTDFGEIDRIENPFGLERDVHDENGKMLFETSRSRSASPRLSRFSQTESRPYRYQDHVGRSVFTSSHDSVRTPEQPRSRSLSPHLERQTYRHDDVSGLERWDDFRKETRGEDILHAAESSRHTKLLYSSNSTPDLSQQQRPISLGYSSPVRSVSQEIWGNRLSGVEGLQKDNQERWKQLIASRKLSDEDIIELKQALASSIVENDILQAKLNNAKSEVSEKLYQTNGILDDCRKHLAKSQAENMELRSNLEHERQERQDLEVRVKELEESLFQSKSEISHLETELSRAREELNRTVCEQPSLAEMRKENKLLREDLSQAESSNISLKQEVEDLHMTQEKAQATIRDLRTCLEEVRQERSQLFEEVMSLHVASNGQKARVQSIIHRYNEKEAKETMNGHLQGHTGNHRDTRRPEVAVSPIRIHSESTPKGHQRKSSLKDEMLVDECPKLDGSLNLSGSVCPSPVSTSHLDLSSPGVPSSYREIYPHRKSRYYGNERRASPLHFSDYPDLQQYPTKLNSSQFEAEEVEKTGDEDRDLSHSNFIRRKLRYSPVPDDIEDRYYSSQDCLVDPATDFSARCYPGRLSRSLHESSSIAPYTDRLNRSYSSIYDYANTNDQPVLGSRRGILKNRTLTSACRLRERSCSPVLQHHPRPHSPPTKLSPRSPRSRPSSRLNVLGRSSSTTSLDKNTNEFIYSNPQISSMKRKAWYELQMQEPALLNDEQRRYADHLIEKYTGIALSDCCS